MGRGAKRRNRRTGASFGRGPARDPYLGTGMTLGLRSGLLALCALCVAGTSGRVLAQAALSYEAGAHYGLLLPQYDFLRPITTDAIRSAEVAVTWPLRRRDHWGELYNRPERGVSLFASTLGGREHLGGEIAATYFFRYYYLRRGRVGVYQRFGIGLTYATRPFDLERNYRNVAIASHLNAHFGTRLGVSVRASPRWRARAGLSFDHLSNANSREPNRGLNYLTAFLGASYTPSPAADAGSVDVPPAPRHTELLVVGYGGRKSSKGYNERYHGTAAVSLEARRRLGWRLSAEVGADLTYNGSVRTGAEVRGVPYRPRDDYQTGLHAGPVLHYRRWAFGLQTGAYLGLGDALQGRPVYNRALLEYRAGRDLFCRVALRSHVQILDFAEGGIAYRLGSW